MSYGTHPDLNRLRERLAQTDGSSSGSPPARQRTAGPLPDASTASFPHVVMLTASSYCLVVRYVPEVQFAPFLKWIFDQVHVFSWVPGDWGFVNVLMLLALLSSGVVAARRVTGDGIWLSVGMVVIALAFSSLTALISEGVRSAGFGVAVAAIVSAVTINSGLALSNATGVDTPPKIPRKTLAAFVGLFVPALALGRWIYGSSLADIANGWSGNAWTLSNASTLWCWAAGTLIATIVALVISLIPLGAANARGTKLAAILLAIVSLFVYVGPEAKSSAKEAVNEIALSSPVDHLSDYCSWWSLGVEPPLTTVFRGAECATVDVYRGGRRTSSVEVPYRLDRGPIFGPADRSIDPYPMVGGVYRDQIVLGAVRGGQVGFVMVNRSTGVVTNSNMCPLGTESAELRFAGAAVSSEDPRRLQITYSEDLPSVFLTCDGSIRQFPM